jgi:hypothetical protein
LLGSGTNWFLRCPLVAVKLYHTTSGSLLDEILADGFPAGPADAGTVRLTDRRPERSASLNGQACVVFDIPEKEISPFEFDELGSTAREFAVPPKVLNRYPILASHPGARPTGTGTRPAPPATPPWRRLPIALAAGVVLLAAAGYAIYSVTKDDEESKPAPRAAAEPKEAQPERAESPPPPSRPEARRTESVAVGTRENGRLVRGVAFPAAGKNHFTWDLARGSSPNPRDRRYGTDYVVRSTLRAIRRYRSRHPDAPKVGIADLSRRRGGDFGPQNRTHENGLVVAVLYPRSDGSEAEPAIVEQVDRRLAQALLDEFARAGANSVSLDSRLGLTPPRGVTQSSSIEPRMHVGFPKR